MLRTPSAVSARTLTRNIRTRTPERQRPGRGGKLRLDTLEAREQPGSVMSGLAAGLAGTGMLEPLAIMAAVVGPNALAQEPSPTPGAAQSAATNEKSVPTTGSALALGDLPVSKPATDGGAAAGPVGNADPAAAAGIDASDLSIGDPAQFHPAALDPASSGGSGGASGSGAGTAASALAGQSTANETAPAGGRGELGGDAGLSVSQPAPTVPMPAAKSRTAPAAGPAAVVQSKETFVNPPNDSPAPEPPAKTQVRTASILTSTNPLFAVGTDVGVTAQVKVYDAQTRALKYTLSPFPNSFTGGARVAVADVTGDGTSDIVVAEGPGGGNLVRVYNGATGKALNGTLGSFSPFTTGQSNGVWVASDDVTGDGKADIVVGTDGNFTPQVKVFSGSNGSLVRTQDVSKLSLSGGVRVAAGDLNGDGKAEVIVGSAPGAVSRVGAFDGANGKALYDYLPFGPDDYGGVALAVGDVTGDGYADVVAGQATGGDQVKVFSGTDTASTWNLHAFPTIATNGVRVGVADVNGVPLPKMLAA